eukprot:TRINITY_DN22578_c0_g1_i2.p1 TRINITY_DN22578_c0_g1~~TRINITY_DN22578_c0_g1_i2.p1  ORF type:complete len:179 (-),score=23.05 TRINITY_DN22578_c0_g1_i2:229-765(-)
MIRRPPRSTQGVSSAASDVYKRQVSTQSTWVSELVQADLLIILSDIDGFYDKDPRKFKDSKLVKEVLEVTEELEACAGGTGSNLGTGGMITKLQAAKRANAAGVDMVLANGEYPEIINNIVKGEDIGTLFVSQKRDRKQNFKQYSQRIYIIQEVLIQEEGYIYESINDYRSKSQGSFI